MAVSTTACPRNCYSTCAIKVHVENGRVRRLEPHPDNVATAGGPCLKGLAYVERQATADRILTPLRRSGSDFLPVSWDEALATIVERLLSGS
ncbi:MAG: hypothetical protein GY953_20150, partial [bacterium]|nr:hypothetical protein [bacterium]